MTITTSSKPKWIPDKHRDEYPERDAQHIWRGDADYPICSIVYAGNHDAILNHWCGYVRFKERLNCDEHAVECHGGITYSEQGNHGTWVYGIDFGHAMDYDYEHWEPGTMTMPPNLRTDPDDIIAAVMIMVGNFYVQLNTENRATTQLHRTVAEFLK